MAIFHHLLLLCVTVCVGTVTYVLVRMLVDEQSTKLRQRLRRSNDDEEDQRPGPFVRLGMWAARPFMPKSREKQASLRRDLAKAGVYSASAIKTLAGLKLLSLIGGVTFGYVLGAATDQTVLGFACGGLAGYMLPTLWLKSKMTSNQKALDTGLPDALDLMVVCVEAGLTIDSAMQRVGEELHLAHPAVARELGIAHMETRIGVSRADALRNLGARTANAGLQSLAAMLVQADRFGTSIGHALRVHAESLRDARHHVAEELAAKASVKMSFPLVLFIFPATFIVLAGPTVLSLMNSSLFE